MPDTSFYRPNQATQPLNPLTAMQQLVTIQSGMNQNQLFQQEFADRAAMSKVFGSTPLDPGTGMPNMPALMQGMQGAGLGRLMPQAMQQLQEMQSRQQTIANTNLDIINKKYGNFNDRLTSLLTQQNISRDDIIKEAIAGAKEGFFDPKTAVSWIKDNIPPDANPDQMRQALFKLLMSQKSDQNKINAYVGASQVVNTGGAQQIVQTPQFGAPRVTGIIQNTPSPDASMQRTPVMVPDGKGGLIPASTTVGAAAGKMLQTGPGLNEFGQTPAEATAKVTYKDSQNREHTVSGADFARLRSIAQGGAIPAPDALKAAAPAAAPSADMASPAMGAPEAASVEAQGVAKQADALRQRAETVPQRKADLQNMRQQLPKFKGGPVAENVLTLKTLANQFNIPWDTKGVAGQEEFNKLANQVALAQLQTLGTGTDEKLSTAIKANPSSLLSNLGNEKIIAFLMGNEDALTAKAQAWQAWRDSGRGAETYGKFQTEFNKTFNPRVFQAEYMDAKGRQEMLKDMSRSERDAFAKSLRYAIQQGWVKAPGAR